MKRIQLLFLSSVAALIAGCLEFEAAPIRSASGAYSISASVNSTDSESPNYAEVVLRLSDRNGQELDSYSSGAGDVMKWALGWMPEEDIVVLYSADVGTRAYDIVDKRLVLKKDVRERSEILNRAKFLYNQKYQ